MRTVRLSLWVAIGGVGMWLQLSLRLVRIIRASVPVWLGLVVSISVDLRWNRIGIVHCKTSLDKIHQRLIIMLTASVTRKAFFHYTVKYRACFHEGLVHRYQISYIVRQIDLSSTKEEIAPRFWLYLSMSLTIFGRRAMHERYNS